MVFVCILLSLVMLTFMALIGGSGGGFLLGVAGILLFIIWLPFALMHRD
jgi:hypothetical protein